VFVPYILDIRRDSVHRRVLNTFKSTINL
jgi:hypothetical protein